MVSLNRNSLQKRKKEEKKREKTEKREKRKEREKTEKSEKREKREKKEKGEKRKKEKGWSNCSWEIISILLFIKNFVEYECLASYITIPSFSSPS